MEKRNSRLMKTKIIIIVTLSLLPMMLTAQSIQQISRKSCDSAMIEIDRLMNTEISEKTKLVGLGDLAWMIKETQTFNTALCAYLISKKKFRNVILPQDEWILKQLNDYLIADSPTDSAKLKLLMLSSFDNPEFNNAVFESFLIWTKNYNLNHKGDKVNLYGVNHDSEIPSAYFLAAYIYPADQTSAMSFAKKWDTNFYDEKKRLKDVEQWYFKLSRSPALPATQKLLAQKCGEDISYNKNLFKIDSATQKFPVVRMIEELGLVRDRIIKYADKKAVLFGSNRLVSKCDISSSFIIDEKTMPSLGQLLDRELHSSYYACVTDFSTPATIVTFDVYGRKLNSEIFQPSEKAKTIFKKGDRYFNSTNATCLDGYLQPTINYYKGFNFTATYNKAILPFDALFIFNELTTSAPITY